MYNKCCDGRFHTIKKGDTLYSLARMYNIPLIMLLKANPFIDVYNMQIGEKVCIPIRCDLVCNEIAASEEAPRTFAYVIMPGETLNDILVKYNISIEDILELNKPEDIIMKPGVAIMLPIDAMNEQGGMGQDGNSSFDGMNRRDFMRESVRNDNMAGENMMPNGMMRDNMMNGGMAPNGMMRDNMMNGDMMPNGMMRDNMMNGDMMPNGMMRDNMMNGGMAPNGMMRDNMMNGGMMPNGMNRDNTMTDDMIRDDMMQDEIMRSDMMREVR